MSKEARTGSFVDRVPVIGGIKRNIERTRQEKAFWTDRTRQWDTQYRAWATKHNPRSDYVQQVSELAAQLPPGRGAFANTIHAEERLGMEKFCQLALVVPQEGVSREDLQTMGFSFPPPTMGDSVSLWRVLVTQYPEGWQVRPDTPDRLDSNGTQWASIYDDNDRARIGIFWSDSESNDKPMHVKTRLIPQDK